MLHFTTVEPHTLSLLNRLMKLPVLQPFSLVGGTALALKYGHRVSVDLDLFSNEKFDNDVIVDALQKEFGSEFVYEGGFSRFGIFAFIENVKVDIVYYPHPLIAAIETENEIRLYSNKDIAAMKIQAILGRGKKKDFWDVAELLNTFSIQEIIDLHQQKFPNQMLLLSIPQALCYFADADESEAPVDLKAQTWETVKQKIQKAVSLFLKNK